MLILWGMFWGAVIGAMVARHGFIGSVVGFIVGTLASGSLSLVLRSREKKTVDGARNELARAWELQQQQARRESTSTTTAQASPAANAAADSSTSAQESVTPTQPILTATDLAQDLTEGQRLAAERVVNVGAPAPIDFKLATDEPQSAAKELQPARGRAVEPESVPGSASVGPPPAATDQPKPQTQISTNPVETVINGAINWLRGGNTVVRVGIIVLLLGLAFLVKYSIDNALLPLPVRLAGVAFAAIALLVVGWRTRVSRPGYGVSLQGAGVVALYLTLFAAAKLTDGSNAVPVLGAQIAFFAMAAVCAFSTILAVAQNAKALAVIGFTGGFLVPVLVSTGSGNHIALFGYFALLNIGVLAITWFKTWRAVSVISFLLTFGIALIWASRSYNSDLHYSSCQAFLLLGWAIYLAISLIYANRANDCSKGEAYVDGTLFFGMALLGFGLQSSMLEGEFSNAFTALGVGAAYLLIARFQAARASTRSASKLMGESALAIGIGFASLAIPLAFGAQVTAAAWAVEGAAIVWISLRQRRSLARLFAYALQGLAALVWLGTIVGFTWKTLPVAQFHFANAAFFSFLLLALGAMAISWLLHRRYVRTDEDAGISRFSAFMVSLDKLLVNPAYIYGFALLVIGVTTELSRNVQGEWLFEPSTHGLMSYAAFVVMVAVSVWIGLRAQWRSAQLPGFASLVALCLMAVLSIANSRVSVPGAYSLGVIVWPVAIAAHYWLMRRLDASDLETPSPLWGMAHTVSVLAIALLIAGAVSHAVRSEGLSMTAWSAVAMTVAGVLVLGALLSFAKSERAQSIWPLSPYLRSYALHAALPIAVVLGLSALLLSIGSSGNAHPLPYIPLLNPLELAIMLAVVAIVRWMTHVTRSGMVSLGESTPAAVGLLAALAFVFINTVWLRICHHFLGVNWDPDQLFFSGTVQAGLSILWTLVAVMLMWRGSKSLLRWMWMVGAGLLGLTVGKLLLVDMYNSAGVTRFIAFIAVGVLIVAVGYVTPLPPKRNERHEREETSTQAAKEGML
jgi:uncharacterized membrane protein